MARAYRHWIDGAFSSVTCAVTILCLLSLLRERTTQQVFSRLCHSKEWDGKTTLYFCSLGSMMMGLIYTGVSTIYFLTNPQNLTVRQCYPINLLSSVWILGKMLTHLFFVNRIHLTFRRTSLALSSIKFRLLCGSIIVCDVGISTVVAVSVWIYIEDGYSTQTRQSIDDIYSCWTAAESIRSTMINHVLILPLLLFDFLFSFIEVRLYVRKLWHLLENNATLNHNSNFMVRSPKSRTIGNNNQRFEAAQTCEEPMPNPGEDSAVSLDVLHLPQLPVPNTCLSLHPSSDSTANNDSVVDRELNVMNDHPPTAMKRQLSSVSGRNSEVSSATVSRRSMSSLFGNIEYNLGIEPMKKRMRTIIESDPTSKSFVDLATRTATLALMAITSNCLVVVCALLWRRPVVSLDVLTMVVCVFFCFDVSSKSRLNPICLRCFAIMDQWCMPCFYLCCELDCCECWCFDCDIHCQRDDLNVNGNAHSKKADHSSMESNHRHTSEKQ